MKKPKVFRSLVKFERLTVSFFRLCIRVCVWTFRPFYFYTLKIYGPFIVSYCLIFHGFCLCVLLLTQSYRVQMPKSTWFFFEFFLVCDSLGWICPGAVHSIYASNSYAAFPINAFNNDFTSHYFMFMYISSLL